ncbi:MAG TPA: FAD-dependent oxidoreductase [Desulfotignum sp.]|nr:FAD-dependent oxidoreductase [Desulfotignum sp.]
MKDLLFEPVTINTLTLDNRIYLPAMHLGMGVAYKVTDPIVEFYALRAKGGAGLICVGFATVDELSGNTQNIGAHDDRFIPGLTRLASAIKDNGSKGAVQLNHAGRYNFSFFLEGKQPVAPSAIASRLTKEVPKAMTIPEIEQTIARFASAALRVKQTGFDAVEILSGTGYLISEFLSPLTNHRSDAYGGSLENRMRFGLQVMAAVRDAVGKDFPLIVRMNGNDFMPGGNPRSELKAYARALAQGPVDALCINVGWHEARVPQIVAQVPSGAYAYLAAGIKEQVDIPVIASHRIDDPDTARNMLAKGLCDMVAMGRSLIADPMLPLKAKQGRENEIVHCVACAQGCFDNLFKLKSVECLCNPLAGHEADRKVKPAGSPRKILVAGAGPAGMMAAVTARRRGHQVVVYEKQNRPGGQLHLAAAPPGRDAFARLAKDLETQLAVEKIPVVLNTAVDSKIIGRENPDAVILATGARPVMPAVPGVDLPHVVQAWDVLKNRAVTGQRVAVMGGNAVGVETALFLADQGTVPGDVLKFLLVNQAEDPDTLFKMAVSGAATITIVEMTDHIGRDIGKSTRWGMLQDLDRAGIETLTGATVTRIIAGGLVFEKQGKERQLSVDTVVIAAGSVADNPLESVVTHMGIPCEVAGDAAGVGTAFDAVHQGFAAGNRV